MPEEKSKDIVSARKERWMDQWMDALMSTYPNESARFFKDTTDPFANPVGSAFRNGIRNLFAVLAADAYDPDAARQALDPMVRVRAVQELAPSAALGFITQIKAIMAADGKALKDAARADKVRMDKIAEHADKALLTAFDLYMGCKKHIYTLRARQASNSVRQLLVKNELICEVPDIDPAVME
ncbi:MAG: RsbRD N-terminal domain-containing protein [Desulfobacterales bacterium]|nr:RsbRD N-terminal domain-containing protein [Desulfobacterales bacterium]